MVAFYVPLAVRGCSVEIELGADRLDVAVLACGRGVVCHGTVGRYAAVTEFVFAGGGEVLGAQRCIYFFAQLQLDQRRGIEQSERAGADGAPGIVAASDGEFRCAGLQIHRPGIAEIACRLENLAFLTVVERNRLHIVERELAEVNLSVLSVAEGHSVVDHSGMICAHRSDVDRLDAAYATVVFYLHSGEISQRVGHAVAVEAFEFAAGEALGGDDFLLGAPGRNHHFRKGDAVGHHSVARAVGVYRAFGNAWRGIKHKQDHGGCHGLAEEIFILL